MIKEGKSLTNNTTLSQKCKTFPVNPITSRISTRLLRRSPQKPQHGLRKDPQHQGAPITSGISTRLLRRSPQKPQHGLRKNPQHQGGRASSCISEMQNASYQPQNIKDLN